MITDPHKISNYINNYFSNIGHDLSSSLPPSNVSPLTYLHNSNYHDFVLLDTSSDEIISIIKSLKDSSPGYDGIHIKIIKKTASVLAPVISKLINMSFQYGIFPDTLKTAKVLPLHKGGKRDNVSNYRPISIIPAVSKIYERAMYNRLSDFLSNQNILSDCQFGFRKIF